MAETARTRVIGYDVTDTSQRDRDGLKHWRRHTVTSGYLSLHPVTYRYIRLQMVTVEKCDVTTQVTIE